MNIKKQKWNFYKKQSYDGMEMYINIHIKLLMARMFTLCSYLRFFDSEKWWYHRIPVYFSPSCDWCHRNELNVLPDQYELSAWSADTPNSPVGFKFEEKKIHLPNWISGINKSSFKIL